MHCIVHLGCQWSIMYWYDLGHFSFILLPQSPDGKLIASGAIDGIINLFDLQSGRLLHTLEGEQQCTCM